MQPVKNLNLPKKISNSTINTSFKNKEEVTLKDEEDSRLLNLLKDKDFRKNGDKYFSLLQQPKRRLRILGRIQLLVGKSINYDLMRSKALTSVENFIRTIVDKDEVDDMEEIMNDFSLWLIVSSFRGSGTSTRFMLSKSFISLASFSQALSLRVRDKFTSHDELTVTRIQVCLLPNLYKRFMKMSWMNFKSLQPFNTGIGELYFKGDEKEDFYNYIYGFFSSFHILPSNFRECYLKGLKKKEAEWVINGQVVGTNRFSSNAESFFKICPHPSFDLTDIINQLLNKYLSEIRKVIIPEKNNKSIFTSKNEEETDEGKGKSSSNKNEKTNKNKGFKLLKDRSDETIEIIEGVEEESDDEHEESKKNEKREEKEEEEEDKNGKTNENSETSNEFFSLKEDKSSKEENWGSEEIKSDFFESDEDEKKHESEEGKEEESETEKKERKIENKDEKKSQEENKLVLNSETSEIEIDLNEKNFNILEKIKSVEGVEKYLSVFLKKLLNWNKTNFNLKKISTIFNNSNSYIIQCESVIKNLPDDDNKKDNLIQINNAKQLLSVLGNKIIFNKDIHNYNKVFNYFQNLIHLNVSKFNNDELYKFQNKIQMFYSFINLLMRKYIEESPNCEIEEFLLTISVTDEISIYDGLNRLLNYESLQIKDLITQLKRIRDEIQVLITAAQGFSKRSQELKKINAKDKKERSEVNKELNELSKTSKENSKKLSKLKDSRKSLEDKINEILEEDFEFITENIFEIALNSKRIKENGKDVIKNSISIKLSDNIGVKKIKSSKRISSKTLLDSYLATEGFIESSISALKEFQVCYINFIKAIDNFVVKKMNLEQNNKLEDIENLEVKLLEIKNNIDKKVIVKDQK